MVIDDLKEIAEKERASRKEFTLRCCMAAGCMSSNSEAVKKGLEKAVKDSGLEDRVEVRGVGCMRLCCQGPLVQVDSDGALYEKVTPEDTASVVGTLKGGATKVQQGDPKAPERSELRSWSRWRRQVQRLLAEPARLLEGLFSEYWGVS